MCLWKLLFFFSVVSMVFRVVMFDMFFVFECSVFFWLLLVSSGVNGVFLCMYSRLMFLGV